MSLRTTKFAALFLSLGMLATTVAVYALDASTGYNLNRLPLETEIGMSSWIPEGWAFFTRAPREERIRVYTRRRNGDWAPLLAEPLSAWSNALGFVRAPRRQTVEQGLLFVTLPKEGWTPCVSTNLARCLNETAPTVSFDNPSPVPSVCGEIAVVKQKPVPFAWIAGRQRDEAERFRIPNSFIRVHATC